MRAGLSARAALPLGLLAALGVAAPLLLAARLGLDLPLGTDAPLWGLSILDAAHGKVPALPPLYGLVGAALHLPGLTVGAAARLTSALGLGMSLLWTGLALREAGTPRALALLAVLGLGLHPDPLLQALLTQPDALAMAAFALVLWALCRAASEAPRPGLLALALLIAWLAREQGMILGLAALLLAPLAAGRRGLAAGLLGLGLVQALVILLARQARLFVQPSWTERLQVLAWDQDKLAQGQAPAFAAGPSMPWRPWNAEAVLATYQRLVEAAALPAPARAAAVREVTALHALLGGLDLLVLLGLGTLALGFAALRARRPALLLPLLPALPVVGAAFLVWSERRHLAVLLPFAWFALGRGLAALPRPAGLGLGLLIALGLPLWQLPTTRAALAELQAQAEARRDAWALGRRLDAALPADARICGTFGVDIIREPGVLLVGAERAGCAAEGDLEAEPGGQPAWMAARLVRGGSGAGGGWSVLDREGDWTALWLAPPVAEPERRARARLRPVRRYVPAPEDLRGRIGAPGEAGPRSKPGP